MNRRIPIAVLVLLVGPLAGASAAGAQTPQTVITVAPYLQAGGERLSLPFLTVYANGELCGRLAFDDPAQLGPDGTTELVLGTPTQPAACATDGATLTIRREDRIPFVDTYILRVGQRIVITNFTIPPPSDPGPEPPDVGTGTVPADDLPKFFALGVALMAAGVVLGASAVRRH